MRLTAVPNLIEWSRNTKTGGAEAGAGVVRVAGGGTVVLGRAEEPTAAAQQPAATIAAGRPRRTVRGALVVWVPAILQPLAHVARHVVQSEAVRRVRPYRGRAPPPIVTIVAPSVANSRTDRARTATPPTASA